MPYIKQYPVNSYDKINKECLENATKTILYVSGEVMNESDAVHSTNLGLSLGEDLNQQFLSTTCKAFHYFKNNNIHFADIYLLGTTYLLFQVKSTSVFRLSLLELLRANYTSRTKRGKHLKYLFRRLQF